MQAIVPLKRQIRHGRVSGFTLAEIVICIAITTVLFSGMILGYMSAARRTEWSGYSLAAQAMAIQQLEQARSARWDLISIPPICDITNVPTTTWTNLDIPYSGTNYTRATNFTTISEIILQATPKISLYLVRVDTVWRCRNKNYTNSIANYYAPDR